MGCGASHEEAAPYAGRVIPKLGEKRLTIIDTAGNSGGQIVSYSDLSTEDAKENDSQNWTNLEFASFGKYSMGGKSMGQDKENQDSAMVVTQFAGQADQALCGVFDGHGPFGHRVSQSIRDNISKFLAEELEKHDDLLETFQVAFDRADMVVKDQKDFDTQTSGSTGVVMYIKGRRVLVANVGDSRCIMGSQPENSSVVKPFELSLDHKPDRADERERVVAAKGRVHSLVLNGRSVGPARVWLEKEDMPGLAVSRSFGDFLVKDVGVVAIPEFMSHQVGAQDKYICLGSDGLYDFMTNEEIVKCCGKFKTAQQAAEGLVREGRRRWEDAGEPNIDDITAVVIMLSPPKAA